MSLATRLWTGDRSRRLGVGVRLFVAIALAGSVVAAGGVHASAAPPTNVTIVATTADRYTFNGWGTSLAWWANKIGGWPSGSGTARDAIQHDLFDAPGNPTAGGEQPLGLNIARYNIGASPLGEKSALGGGCPTLRPGGYVPTPAQTVGETNPVKFDWNADHKQLAILQDAYHRIMAGPSPVWLEAFANSPPWWMNNPYGGSSDRCPSGNSSPGDLLPSNALQKGQEQAYADYLAAVVAYLDNTLQLPIHTVDPFNEPGYVLLPKIEAVRWPGKCRESVDCQEGANFDRHLQKDIIRRLCTALQRRAAGTYIAAPDGNTVEETVDLYNDYTGDPTVRYCVQKINSHDYSDSSTDTRKALAALGRPKGNELWMSEFTTGGGTNNMDSALKLSNKIATDLQYMRPQAWVYWQAVEEQSTGYGLIQVPKFDSPGTPTLTKQFSAMAQYSRFIKPGDDILTTQTRDATPSGDPKDTLTVAAYDPQANSIVLVSTNTDTSFGKSVDRSVTFDLSGLGSLGVPVDVVDVYRTRTNTQNGTVNAEPNTTITVNGSSFTDMQQPAHSITTYVVHAPGLPGVGRPPSTHLTYTGPTSADYHDAFTASATLTAGGTAVSGAPVTFTLGSGGGTQTCTATTTSSGAASCALTPNEAAGPTTLTVSFAGTPELPPANTRVGFAITREEDTVAYTGPTHIANGVSAQLSGMLKEDGTVPIAGRTVDIALGGGSSQQTCSGTTDSTGTAQCTIASVNQSLNDTATVPVTVTFTGDAYYLPSTASTTVRLEYYTGRAFGLSANVNLPLLSVIVPPTPDTGPIRIAQASSTTTACTATVDVAVVTAKALCPNVTTRLAPGTSTATSTVADVTIGIPGLPVIEISGITALSTSTCGAATGSTNIVTLRIGGTSVPVPTPPNSEINLVGVARLIINEQRPVADADYGLTVNAAHLIVTGGVADIVVASATSDAHNCS